MIRASVRFLAVAAVLAAIPVSAFHDDEERAKAAAAYRAAVLANGAANAASADAEAARIEELKPRLTESQRGELERCQANGMIYVSPTVGCRLFWEDR
jgi:hypothetical protein